MSAHWKIGIIPLLQKDGQARADALRDWAIRDEKLFNEPYPKENACRSTEFLLTMKNNVKKFFLKYEINAIKSRTLF